MREIIAEIRQTYVSAQKQHTLRHAEAVADTAVRLARRYELDADKAYLAALLHDISVIMKPDEQYALVLSRGLPIDPAEEKYHFLLHQRISRIIAQERFGIADEEILQAVECHTTLKPHAGKYDMILFLADKISWDQPGTPPYAEALTKLADGSLAEACRYYIQYQFDNQLLLMPHRWLSAAYEELKRLNP